MIRIGKYVVYDLLRNRFVILYTAFLMLVTFSVFSLDSDAGKSTLSLLNIVLLVVPVVSVIFTSIHFYNSYEFIELLLSQPVDRKTIFFAEFFSVAMALGVAFLVGAGIPVLIMNFSESSLYLVLGGLLLTFVFVALAFAGAVSTRDKARGIGVGLLFWFYFTLIYDGFVLYIIYAFSDYPIEKLTLALITLNPVDLTRIIILLKLDLSALMGYTGAFYKNFFGTAMGTTYSIAFVLVWIAVPLLFAWRKFVHKDI
jgi:Cu-processing system permease protein